MSSTVDRLPDGPRAIEIRIGNVDFVSKISAIGAAIAAVREAHREELSANSWAHLEDAQRSIAGAILDRNDRRLIGR